MDYKDPEWVLRDDRFSESFDLRTTKQAELSAWGGGKSKKCSESLLPSIRLRNKKVKVRYSKVVEQDRSCEWNRMKNKYGLSEDSGGILRKFSPSVKLCQEIRAYLNQPCIPVRDIRKFRKDIQVAVGRSKTIEELLKQTKIPVTKLLKNSETWTSPAISPLKQYQLSPQLKQKFYKINKKLF